MRFLDKVKSLKNAVTGGAAKVTVDADSFAFGEPFLIHITAVPQGGDVKYDRVYVEVRGYERVKVTRSGNGNSGSSSTVRENTTI